jgi:hypothetical protein
MASFKVPSTDGRNLEASASREISQVLGTEGALIAGLEA